MKNSFMSLCLTLVIIATGIFGFSTRALAINSANENVILSLNEQTEDGKIDAKYLEQHSYKWEITSKTISSYSYGGWRVGPTGYGPGSISINESSNLNRSFTATISGSFPIGTQPIGASIGVTIGKSYSYGTSYTVPLASGERKTIIYRPKIKTYKIVQTYYRINNYTGKKEAIKTATAYVDAFQSWDYNWRYGY